MKDADAAAARIFHVLCEPAAVTLLLHVLEGGRGGRDVEGRLDVAAGSATVHLDRLVDAGLLVRTSGPDGYRVTDPIAVERLLETVRQLGRRTGAPSPHLRRPLRGLPAP